MPSRSAIPPQIPAPELVARITKSAERLQQNASSVSQRIEQLEAWLASLPGQIAVISHSEIPSPDESNREPYYFSLMLGRLKGKWRVLYGYSYETSDPEWTPLVEATMDTKLLALSHIGGFLEKLHQRQMERLNEIEVASHHFDDLAAIIQAREQKEASDEIPF